VSAADREAEAAIAALLESERPEDGLVAEEGSSREGTSGRRWVVDPLDGTTNFLYGHPQWCVSVALDDSEGTLVGVVHAPVAGETFVALRGAGAWLDDQQLSVREPSGLERALVATGFGYTREARTEQAEVLRHLLPAVRDIRRDGSAALDLAWLAAGRLDAYFERGGKAWDWAAGRLLVTEAGGAAADLPGDPPGIAAASGELLPPLLDLLASA